MPNSNCKLIFLLSIFVLFQVKISKNVKLYMKNCQYLVLFPGGFSFLSAFYIKQVKLSAIG